MEFADLHIHALYGVDDGAQTEEDMRAMVDASYEDGIRTLCLTSHFHPGYFGDNREKINAAFSALEEYASQKYPDLALYLGNELRYSQGCVSWLDSGQCRTLNGTQYVLVDFSEDEEGKKLSNGLERLLNAGYRPVLAHVERYRSLWGKLKLIRSFQENGVLLQVDSQSILGGFGYRAQRQSKLLLEDRLVDLICSDSHDIRRRPPGLSRCFQIIQKKYGTDCAQALFFNNGVRLLRGAVTKEELD